MAARTDYLIDGPREATVYLTAAKSNHREGRPFCARTTDGGLTWKFVSFIGDEPAGFAIMPSTVRLSKNGLLTMVRVKDGQANRIDSYTSSDNGAAWSRGDVIADTGAFGGNPPMLFRLRDGRLCVTYGFRSPPYGIRALFVEETSPPVVWLIGADPRGSLYAAGALLRRIGWSKGNLNLAAPLDLETAPAYSIRGHQLGYRTQANSYDAWDQGAI